MPPVEPAGAFDHPATRHYTRSAYGEEIAPVYQKLPSDLVVSSARYNVRARFVGQLPDVRW